MASASDVFPIPPGPRRQICEAVSADDSNLDVFSTRSSRPKKIAGFEGGFWEQVRADDIVARVSAVCHRAGVRQVFGDQREAFALEADFRRCGLRFTEYPYTSGSKASAVERVRRWLRDGTVIFKEHDRLRSELINFVEKPTPGGGFTFGARGSGHDDYCCLVLTAALADMAGDIPRSPLAQNRGRGGMPAEGLG